MSDICKMVKSPDPMSLDFGDLLHAFIAETGSKESADKLRRDGKIAEVLLNGDLENREAWRTLGFGDAQMEIVGFEKPKSEISNGITYETVIYSHSDPVIDKQQFICAMRRFCANPPEFKCEAKPAAKPEVKPAAKPEVKPAVPAKTK